MPTSILKSQKTSNVLGNLHVNDWKENGGRIGMVTLHLISRHLQRSDRGPIRFKKRSQYNEPSFRFLARSQDTKN